MTSLKEQALACARASRQIAAMDTVAKRQLLRDMADALRLRSATILQANARDLEAAAAKGISGAMLDRLRLDPDRLASIAAAVRHVASLDDPVGQITRREVRPNGIEIERQRVPLGVVAMIYEARPNVTADAAALCLFAGNGVILRGGSEAIHSNTAIASALSEALQRHGLDPHALVLVTDLRRETMLELLQLVDIVDLAIPRGGEGLIRFVAEHARVPVIKHYKGVCHLYVETSADLNLALDLLIDGKTSRPGVCNALETLLVDSAIAAEFLPRALSALQARGVEVRGDEQARLLLPEIVEATDQDYAAEYLDLIIAVKVVHGVDAAVEHIRRYGSDHTEVIASQSSSAIERFIAGLRSAVVMVNASSRFSDGGELGLGAEIGISTTRLHAYGPMGAESLTVERYLVRGSGQVRHPVAG
ncbi:glutamate-5-semialdehyde dehydrogenase [Frateuria aurantia]